jgi:hypothetical protein
MEIVPEYSKDYLIKSSKVALKLRSQWISFSGMVALKVRTGGSEWSGIINQSS